MLVIRQSRPDDLDQLHRIWADAVRATHGFLSLDDFETISRIVRAQYLPNAIFWVAVDGDDLPVAFLGADGDKIESLFVHPAQHGRGLGRALIEHAFAPDAAIHVDVNEANAQARAFYVRLGFVECGRSETDGSGKPYPLIHMMRAPGSAAKPD